MNNPFSPIDIVLVRPAGDANIGAVCRAMKSMGFSSLVLVLPDGRSPEEEMVRTWALSAFDLYEAARIVTSLEEALAESSWSVGLTRRSGTRRKQRPLGAEEAAGLAAARAVPGERLAFVFGNEAAGLSREELDACNLAASIDTDAAFPSLNLSHAVQLVCYLLRRAFSVAETHSTRAGVDRRAAVDTADAIVGELRAIGFFTLSDSAGLLRYFRDLLQRAGMSEEESDYFRRLFTKIRNLKLHRK